MIDDLPIDRAELLTDERGAYGLAILAHDDSPFSCGNRPLTAIYRRIIEKYFNRGVDS